MNEAIASCKSLVAHHRYALGLVPIQEDWDDPSVAAEMVDAHESFIPAVKAIQMYIQSQ
jgi:hypothetical protein